MEYTSEVKNRLKRIEGQIRGVLRMMDEENDCKAVVTQLSAARTALDRSIASILAHNLQQVIQEQGDKGESETETAALQEAIKLLVKSR